MESPTVPNLQFAELPAGLGGRLAYHFSKIPSPSSTQTVEGQQMLVVFVNGLGLPQAFWQPTIQLVKQNFTSPSYKGNHHNVSVLTYDRYGQGLSRSPDDPPKPHDPMAAAHELDAMIQFTISSNISDVSASEPVLFLVAHSIGVPIARLYCQQTRQHSGKQTAFSLAATALLILDSNMTNTDFVSIFPDPSSAAFDPVRDLPPDTTIAQLEWTRANYRKLFHPSNPNPENLDRSTLQEMLPSANLPVLIGPGGTSPVYLGIIAHEPETFSIESLKISTAGLTERYMEPAWQAYHEGLLNIGRAPDGQQKIVVAKRSGHFVQRNNPACVAAEILKMLEIL